MIELATLLSEYGRALDHTQALTGDLRADEVLWRPHPHSSAIGWHLGHQAAVAHFMLRNLTAAERSPDAQIESIMDSATDEVDRGQLPDVDRVLGYRTAVAARVRSRIGAIASGDVGAPDQLRIIATTVMTALINHEYQHSAWIAEVRLEQLGRALPPSPTSPHLTVVDGYVVVAS
jgi:hypothetical protein